MKKLNIRVEHIYHSGFTVETENYFLVFDYYKGDIALVDKNTIVFASHSHEDHYNPKILEWKEKMDIDYVFSSDIEMKGTDKKIHFMDAYEELNLKGIQIQTFGSTDLGVSFLLSIDGTSIFHAGDLYWWHWEGDTKEDQINAKKSFKEEIERIKGNHIDLAFFPVDPRLEKAYYLGGEYFINELSPKYFIPMHFGDNFHVTSKFIHKMKDTDTHIIELTHRNQIINI